MCILLLTTALSSPSGVAYFCTNTLHLGLRISFFRSAFNLLFFCWGLTTTLVIRFMRYS